MCLRYFKVTFLHWTVIVFIFTTRDVKNACMYILSIYLTDLAYSVEKCPSYLVYISILVVGKL